MRKTRPVVTLKLFFFALAMALIALPMVGCGGSDGGSDDFIADGGSDVDNGYSFKEGVFLDSEVSGVQFRTESLTGQTGPNGEFLYQEGETVLFHIGDIILGDTFGKPIVTPVDLVDGAVDESHPAVTNIARFLQTLDSDDEPENGIQLNDTMIEFGKGVSVEFNVDPDIFHDEPAVQQTVAVMTAARDKGQRNLVFPVVAQYHLKKTLRSIEEEEADEGETDGDEDADDGADDGDTDGDEDADDDADDGDTDGDQDADDDADDDVVDDVVDDGDADEGTDEGDTEAPITDTVTLENGYQVDLVSVVYELDTTELTYSVQELEGSQDLSHWVLSLPDCVEVRSATEVYELVGPDPTTQLTGIKWDLDDTFTNAEFTVLLNGLWKTGTVTVGMKSTNDASFADITGPICEVYEPEAEGGDDGEGEDEEGEGEEPPIESITLENGYQIDFVGAESSDSNTTFSYRVTEQEGAKDLSNWVLELPECIVVVEATFGYELVAEDPNAGLAGIKWEVTDDFTSDLFTVTVMGEVETGMGYVAAKGGTDVTLAEIAIPTCTVESTDEPAEEVDEGEAAEPGARVLVCHNGMTLTVAAPALEAHLAHGDTLGACEDTDGTDDDGVDEGDVDEGDVDEGDVDEGDVDEGDVDEGDVDEGDVDEGDVDEGDVDEGDVDEGDVDEGDVPDADDNDADDPVVDEGDGDAEDGDAGEMVSVCHNGRTITVAASAVDAHIAHGDSMGPCEDAEEGDAGESDVDEGEADDEDEDSDEDASDDEDEDESDNEEDDDENEASEGDKG